MLERSKYYRIIVNFPTHLGDTILALPILDKIKANFLRSKITVIASIHTKLLLLHLNSIDEVIVFDKRWNTYSKIRFTLALRGQCDLFIDFKNTAIPFLVGVKWRTPLFRRFSKNMHITDKYFSLVEGLELREQAKHSELVVEKDFIEKIRQFNLPQAVFLACSSRTYVKAYQPQFLFTMVDQLRKLVPVAVVGVESERSFYKEILGLEGVYDLVGKTTIVETFYLLEHFAKLVVGVDSSILHLASYLGIPTIGLFGPTHPNRSRPRSKGSVVLQQQGLSCVPCEKSECIYHNECMQIPAAKVLKAIQNHL